MLSIIVFTLLTPVFAQQHTGCLPIYDRTISPAYNPLDYTNAISRGETVQFISTEEQAVQKKAALEKQDDNPQDLRALRLSWARDLIRRGYPGYQHESVDDELRKINSYLRKHEAKEISEETLRSELRFGNENLRFCMGGKLLFKKDIVRAIAERVVLQK